MAKAAKHSTIVEIDIKEIIPRVFILFLQAAHAVQKYYDSELYFKAGLSMPKLAVLQVLDANGGTMMPSKIADRLIVAKHNITTLVGRLNKDGLVRVERGLFADRRQAHVILTDKGRKALKQTQPLNKKLIKEIMDRIDKNAAISLEQVLKILRQNAVEGLDRYL